MTKSLVLLSALSTTLVAAPYPNCASKPPVPCNTPQCGCVYCLGPPKPIANAPVCPKTCGGDVIFDVSALYWVAHEDGLEYAEVDRIMIDEPLYYGDLSLLNQIVDAKILTPLFKWNWGFKAGVGYCSPCDGWDYELIWTWYRGKAHDNIQIDAENNQVLLNLWSAYASVDGTPPFSRGIETFWNLKLNVLDFELGRHYWTSRYLSFRPFIGVRYASLRQDYDITSRGGIFSELVVANEALVFDLPAQIDFVKLSNDFRGAGILAGLDSNWNVGCGFALYGRLAASLIYGRFDVDAEESIVFAATRLPPIEPSDFTGTAGTKNKIIDGLKHHFRASRGIFDLSLGVQWATLYCDCKYGFTAQLGWEQHLFFHQNQFWSVKRVGASTIPAPPSGVPLTMVNNTGENVYYQHRGTLDTQGLTLTLRFEF